MSAAQKRASQLGALPMGARASQEHGHDSHLDAHLKKKVRTYTWDEISKHNKENDCWVVINGAVCDVTQWIPDHPGGKMVILSYAGIAYL